MCDTEEKRLWHKRFREKDGDDAIENLIKITCNTLSSLEALHTHKFVRLYYKVEYDYDYPLAVDFTKVKAIIKTLTTYYLDEALEDILSIDFMKYLNDFKEKATSFNKPDIRSGYIYHEVDYGAQYISLNSHLGNLLIEFKTLLNILINNINKKNPPNKANLLYSTVAVCEELISQLSGYYKEYTKIIFADKIKKLCKDKGITQTRIAELMNIRQQSVNAWFNARKLPNVDRLLELTTLLDTSIDYLINPHCHFSDLSEDGFFKKYHLTPESLQGLETLYHSSEIRLINYLLSEMKNNEFFRAVTNYLEPKSLSKPITMDSQNINELKNELLNATTDDIESVIDSYFDNRHFAYVDYDVDNHLLFDVIKELIKLKQKSDTI